MSKYWNELADQAAKAALGFSISDAKCPPTDLYHELAGNERDGIFVLLINYILLNH